MSRAVNVNKCWRHHRIESVGQKCSNNDPLCWVSPGSGVLTVITVDYRLKSSEVKKKKKMHGAESRRNQVQAPNPNGVYPVL